MTDAPVIRRYHDVETQVSMACFTCDSAAAVAATAKVRLYPSCFPRTLIVIHPCWSYHAQALSESLRSQLEAALFEGSRPCSQCKLHADDIATLRAQLNTRTDELQAALASHASSASTDADLWKSKHDAVAAECARISLALKLPAAEYRAADDKRAAAEEACTLATARISELEREVQVCDVLGAVSLLIPCCEPILPISRDDAI